MKRAGALLVSVMVAVSALGTTASPILARTADIWSNSDGFRSACVGFNNTYPSQMYSMARSQMATLGYSPINGALGSSFTKANFLGHVLSDWGVYVHSHGDNYWASSGAPNVDSGFLQDPGTSRCNSSSADMVRSSAIKSATRGSPYNLVVMSTCYLGGPTSTMPGAFQIEKMKTNIGSHEFFLGYVHSTFDSAAYRFESAFFTFLNGGTNHNRTVHQAFTYAAGIGGYTGPNSSNPFEPNWWGDPNYNGVAG